MSNKPSNDRGGRRPGPRADSALPLSQVGREEAPLLIPILPNSSIEEICALVREAGAARVELLVPDGTRALQSIAGNEMLRESAKAAGMRVTLFTADEKTTDAARFAKLDVVSVGGTVAAPRPGETLRRPTGPRPAIQPQTPPLTPRPPATEAQASRQSAASSLPPSDADFLSQLEALDEAAVDPPRLQRSDEGALLYDAPGDIGVPSPAHNDAEWQAAFGELGTTMAHEPEEAPLPPPRSRRRQQQQPIDELDERPPRPSLLGALLGVLPQRSRRRVADDAAASDDGMRMARPERTPEEVAARRRQSRNLILGPLVGLAVLVGLVLIVLGTQGSLNFSSALSGVGLGNAPTIAVEPPLSTTEAVTFTNQVVPLVTNAITDAASINVQGVLLTEPITVTLPGTAASRAVVPIGFAKGGVTLRNQTSQAVTIPAGTIVPAGGQEFVFDTDVTVPASRDTGQALVYGFAEATLTARLPGSQGNIPAGTINAIPNLTNRQFSVSQPAAFSGGTDQEVTIVSPDDVNQLLPQALTQLYAQGVQRLQAQVQERPNLTIYSGQITPTQEFLKTLPPDQYSAVFPPIGQVAQDGTFTLQVFRTFEALAGPTDRPMDQELQRALTNQIRVQRPDLVNATISITGWRRGDQGLIVDAVAVPQGGYQALPESFTQQIEQAIRGKSREEAEAYLQQLKEAGTIRNFNPLPQEWQMVPDNVGVAVSTPSTDSSQ